MLEAALLYLNIVTVPEMPRQIFVEEMVEDALSLCKQQLAALSEAVDTETGPTTPATSRRSSGNGRRVLSVSELSQAGKLVLVLERLPDLVSARCLNDSLILQLGQLSLNAAFGAPTLPLQVVAMEILLAIFVEYAVHRAALLTEMLDLRLQIADAPARESRRTYALADGARIQTFSALALLLMQSAAVLPGRQPNQPWSGAPGAVSAAGASGSQSHPYRGAVTECASQLLRALASRCLERSDDTEAKALLDEFVRDILLVLGRPEWPAAALLVTLLSTILCRRLEKKKPPRTPNDKNDPKADKDELAARLVSLDLLGQILAALAAQRRMHAEAPLIFPADKEEVDESAQPNDAGEDARCVCGRGYDATFMLDCDKCHRWFHGDCVGVKHNDDKISREWYCDSCQLSRAVAEQRRTITRLLSLSDAGTAEGTAQGSAAASEEAVNALCTEEEVTKQLLLNYLDAASPDPASSAAHRLLLCQWHFNACERKEMVLCRLYEEQDAAHTKHCRGPRELHAARVRSLPLLTRDRILSATRRLLVGSPLLGRLETMIAYVLLVLKEPQPSARTKAIKAISGVVTADPSTLEMAGVKQAVHLALCEPSIAVREATLDLVGQYILSRPAFVPLYYEPIVRRLADVGISVRKRVVRILRDLCLKDPSSKLAVDACRRLMARVCDEDEVQKLVVRVFYELWFMPPSGGEALTQEESNARCIHLVNVVAGATAQWSDWLRQLLLKLLTPPADGKGVKEYTGTLHVSSQLVAQLTEVSLPASAYVCLPKRELSAPPCPLPIRCHTSRPGRCCFNTRTGRPFRSMMTLCPHARC
jgi:cohesin loading factor subunit SCC2